MKKKNNLNSVAINIISVVFTIIFSAFSFTNFDNDAVTFISLLLTVFLLVIVAYLYFLDAVNDYRDSIEKEKQMHKELDLLNAMPHLLVFSERTDTFYVESNGDGYLKWNFHIVKETDKLSHLYFPVMFERAAGDINIKSEYLEIIESKINDTQCQVEYVKNTISYVENGDPLESGHIAVLVLLDDDVKEFDLYLYIKIKQLFKRYKKGEFIIVDIPYITRELQVTINTEHRLNVSTSFFEAHEASANNLDPGEIDKQINNCTIKEKSLIWKTRYPKLGYRYRISFQMRK